MLELFRLEAEEQTAILTNGLLELEHGPGTAPQLEALMRAAHSLKGAARLVDLDPAVWIAHAMEDCFVAAQKAELPLTRPVVDVLFRGVDLLQSIGRQREDDFGNWAEEHRKEIRQLLDALAHLLGAAGASQVPAPRSETSAANGNAGALPPPVSASQVAASLTLDHAPPGLAATVNSAAGPAEAGTPNQASNLALTAAGTPVLDAPAGDTPCNRVMPNPEARERVLRLSADSLNRLLGLAGEAQVESHWLHPFTENMQRLKRLHGELHSAFNRLRGALSEPALPVRAEQPLLDLANQLNACNRFLHERLEELDRFDRRSAQLSQRLYLEVLRTRMRPFSEGVRRLPRLVRDLAQQLGKEVRLEIVGQNTPVDRDILEQLETPLAHLLRNAVDHGCEPPEARRRLGKSLPAVIRLEARHSAGTLLISVSDDGAGVSPDRLRERILAQGRATPELAQNLTHAELLEFLFLPGFTLADRVTEISGRGVGLDAVKSAVKAVRGSLQVSSQPGAGTCFQLQLPLTLSVLRTLLVEIGGEPYALPLGQISRALQLPRAQIHTLEGRQHFSLRNESIALLAAHQVFGCESPKPATETFHVVVIGDRASRYGLVVDRFLGERELVVQPLDPRLGKVQNICAAATMEDGMPVLIVDVEDVLRSAERLVADGRLVQVSEAAAPGKLSRRKRVLVVEDSLTVRELERKLLLGRDLEVDVAVDGMDGWNTVRAGQYDLVITDVDMPRMDGIELTQLIKRDARLATVPVLIVTYKDREQDRLRGLQAGADYYLTKGGFHDETLLQAVEDLIGRAGE